MCYRSQNPCFSLAMVVYSRPLRGMEQNCSASSMSLFFITGLPRNRTAWLSVLLSHGEKSFCTHDGLKNHSPKQLVHAMRESDYDYAGDSDSALLLHVEEIIALAPDAL